MDTTARGVSSCRHCQFYKMEGRRGGFCHQLGVLVQGRWRACSFASPLFAAPITPDTPALMSLQKALDLESLDVAAEPLSLLEEHADPVSEFIASSLYSG